ncbi:hypothetical protein [Megasphaera stantonii]|uniref:hypothetical protein n=1 Tax=Megasphaera stantonii TaxID=2144175 RepID=UPI00320A3D58
MKKELRIRNDFFDQDCINWILSQPNGSLYILLYLYLCCLSLHDNEAAIPYNVQWIQAHTPVSIDGNVIDSGIQLLVKAGLLEVNDASLVLPSSNSVIVRRAI